MHKNKINDILVLCSLTFSALGPFNTGGDSIPLAPHAHFRGHVVIVVEHEVTRTPVGDDLVDPQRIVIT